MNTEYEELLKTINNNLKIGFDLIDDQDSLTAHFNIKGEAKLSDRELEMKIIVLNQSESPFEISNLYLFEESTNNKISFKMENTNIYLRQNQSNKAKLKAKLPDQTYFRKYNICLKIVGYAFELDQEIYPRKIKKSSV